MTGSRELCWTVRETGRALDGAAVYAALFAADPVAFWLDSSRSVPGLSPLSVLGTSAGPDAEVLSYRVGDDDIFELLRKRLAVSGTPAPALPEGFKGGYVGYFGYELKALTGGSRAHLAPTPDALWIWANRFVLIDPERDRTWFVAVHREQDAADALAWTEHARQVCQGPVDVAAPAIAALEIEPHLELSREQYVAAIGVCRAALEAGQTYEVCLTNR